MTLVAVRVAVKMYVGTWYVGTISLYKTGAATRSLVLLPRFSTLRSGKIKLVVSTSSKTVKIDAIVATTY